MTLSGDCSVCGSGTTGMMYEVTQNKTREYLLVEYSSVVVCVVVDIEQTQFRVTCFWFLVGRESTRERKNIP